MNMDLDLDLSSTSTNTNSNISASATTAKKKKPCGKGRRKVEIERIDDASRRMVAFSKRKKGLFNKAGDLHRLCDATIAVIIISPSGRLYCFGKPSAGHVINRFLRDKEEIISDVKDCVTDDDDEKEVVVVEEEEEENEESTSVEDINWWEDDELMEGLSFEELMKYKLSLETIRKNVAAKLDDLTTRRDSERDFLSSF